MKNNLLFLSAIFLFLTCCHDLGADHEWDDRDPHSFAPASTPANSAADDDEAPPRIIELVVDPPPAGNPLARRLRIRTDAACSLGGYVTTDTEPGYGPAFNEPTLPSTVHELWFVGLIDNRTFDYVVHLADDPSVELAAGSFDTPHLPLYVPRPIFLRNSEEAAPDIWLAANINARSYTDSVIADRVGYLMLLDRKGRPRFMYKHPQIPTYGVIRFRNGNLCFNDEENIWEVDPYGNAWMNFPLHLNEPFFYASHHQHYVADYDAETALTLFTLMGPGLWCDMTTPTQRAVGDGVAEVDRAGNELWRWSVFDHLDVIRPEDQDLFYCIVPFWGLATVDFSHGNSVVPLPEQDAFLLSFRNLKRIVKVDKTTGDVLWQLGEGLDFTWIGDEPEKERWFLYQHDPQWLGNNRLLLFDNGNCRYDFNCIAGPWSRAMELEIDEDAMNVRLVWEHRVPFSPAMGNVERMANGNTLVCSGATGEVYEVTPDGREVWSMNLPPLEISTTIHTAPAYWVYE